MPKHKLVVRLGRMSHIIPSPTHSQFFIFSTNVWMLSVCIMGMRGLRMLQLSLKIQFYFLWELKQLAQYVGSM